MLEAVTLDVLPTGSVEDRIRSYIEDTFLFGVGGAALSSTESLFERGVIDSTGILELVSFLEATFDLSVRDEELVPENFDSIERLGRFVRRKRDL